MIGYFTSIWRCRYFWTALATNDLQTRYRRSMLGIAWSLLHPIAMSVVLCTVFHTLFHQNVREFAPFLLAGLSLWGYFSQVIIQGCHCFSQGEVYIRQHPSPLVIYPLRVNLTAGFHFLLTLVVVVILSWALRGFDNLPALLSLLPTLLLLFVLGWSLAILAGFANTYFPDTSHLSEVGLQMVFYMTPVIYPPDILRARGLGWFVDANPLTSLLALIREPILVGEVPSAGSFAYAGLTVLVVAAAAALVVRRLQSNLVFHL